MISSMQRALRSLRRSPAYTLTILLTLGLGLGLNVAIFGIAYGILLRPLDLPQPDRLVTVGQDMTARGGGVYATTSRGVFSELRERSDSFERLATYIPYPADLTDVEPPENVQAAVVSHEMFPLLGVEPDLGRNFLPGEEVEGEHFVAVLSHGIWQRRFGGDPGLLGRTITVNDAPYTVVGILPEGFRAPLIPETEIWSPLPLKPVPADHGHSYVRVLGRLAPGVEPQAAASELDRLAAALAAEYPDALADVGLSMRSLHESIVGKRSRWLWLLVGAAGLVLLAICGNIASLTLTRETARRRDTAVELALGAARKHLVRRIVAEALLLGTAAVMLGVGVGRLVLELLRAVAPAGTPRLEAVRLDLPVALYAIGAALACALLIGLIPALTIRRRQPAGSLGISATTSGDRTTQRLRGVLIVAEVAVGVVLLLGGGLLMRTLDRLGEVDPGFAAQGLVLGQVTLSPNRYPEPADMAAFLAEVERGLAGRPEVAAVGSATSVPLARGGSNASVEIEGLPARSETPDQVARRGVSPGFFEALEIPVTAGRAVAATDTLGSQPVAVVNQRFAERFLVGREPLGLRIRIGVEDEPDAPWRTIVGVVGDVRGDRLDEAPAAEAYVPIGQWPPRIATLVARPAGSPSAALDALRETPSQVRSGQIVSHVTTMEEVLARELSTRRFLGRLIGAFALLTLVLIAVGVYGVVALAVAERRTEIAIRQALGASRAEVVGRLLRWSVLLVAAGLVAGLALAVPAGDLLAGYLYGVEPMDAATVAGVCLLLLLVGFLATLRPALRGAGADPARTLRSEV